MKITEVVVRHHDKNYASNGQGNHTMSLKADLGLISVMHGDWGTEITFHYLTPEEIRKLVLALDAICSEHIRTGVTATIEPGTYNVRIR